MDAENVAAKRSEPETPVIDIKFDSPDNKKEGKLPKSEVDPVKPLPYPLEPSFGSGLQPSSSSSGPVLQPVPDLPAFRSQSGVMTVQPPMAASPQFGQPLPTTYGPAVQHGPQMHDLYATSNAHYNPQAYQANTADNRINAQFADNRQVWIDQRQIQQMDFNALQWMLDS